MPSLQKVQCASLAKTQHNTFQETFTVYVENEISKSKK
jgi:hypothetical protein